MHKPYTAKENRYGHTVNDEPPRKKRNPSVTARVKTTTSVEVITKDGIGE
tara:strand:+ start:820 stop:969 length:150 start_codon:yes stop_codon:yes gene_type:complete